MFKLFDACLLIILIAVVPLSTQHPGHSLDYYIKDSDARVVITTPEHLPVIEPYLKDSNRHVIIFDETLRKLARKGGEKTFTNVTEESLVDAQTEHENSTLSGLNVEFYEKSDAVFLYTSGTTGKPKGEFQLYPIN